MSTDDTYTVDNPAHLGALCGPSDTHLVLIEQRTGVAMFPKGNEIGLRGGPGARAQARAVLDLLQRRILSREQLGLADVDACCREAAMPHAAPDSGAGHVAGEMAISLPRRTIRPRTVTQGVYLRALATHELVFGVGPAGTGKTYLAVARAAYALLRGEVDKLILSRPAVEAGERIGFLPGDLKEKVDPYLRPLYDALYDVVPADVVDRRIAAGDIEIAPLAFMRGRTLARAVVILDEAQNATIAQMKMFLTRLGEGSRMVITGDPSQTDLPDAANSGLDDAIGLVHGIEGVAVTRFAGEDVVRHRLVREIVAAYDQRARAQTQAARALDGTRP